MQKRKTYRKIVRNRKTMKKWNIGGIRSRGMPSLSRMGDSKLLSQSRSLRYVCTPIHAFTELAAYVKPPHHANLQQYNSAGCDLYIDIDEKPHIHIHGYRQTEGQNGTYYYSISGKNIHNRPVPLLSKTDHGYKSVLVEMYNALKGTTHELPAYFSPPRSTSEYTSARPMKSRVSRVVPFSETIGESRRKLGPIMSKFASITPE